MRLVGNNNVSLRLVDIGDAEFILKLRRDQDLSKYLSKSADTVVAQRKFITNYKNRESLGDEYYFIIQKDNIDIGCVRVYNINKLKKTFSWGSWIVMRNNPGYVALSSAYLSYYFAFNKLLLNEALFDVRNNNLSVKKLYLVYAEMLHEDDINCYFSFKKENFNNFINVFEKKIPSDIKLI